jgi:DNA-binding CsgD family transcriptional regulator
MHSGIRPGVDVSKVPFIGLLPKKDSFVGRLTELRLLTEALRRVVRSGPQLAVIEGPPGVGKTALLEEFLASATDIKVILATGDPGEQATPFGVVDQWLNKAGDVGSSVLDLTEANYVAVAQRLLERVRGLQGAGPVVLTLDDAQWADVPSLRVLLFVQQRLALEAVLVIVALREGEAGRLPEGLRKGSRRSGGLSLRLAPLTTDELRQMAASFGISLAADEARRLRGRTGGYPLYARALFSELPQEAWTTASHPQVPPSLRSMAVVWLESCSDSARRLVEAAAVLGERAHSRDVLRLADVALPFDALGEATRVGLLRVEEERGRTSVAFVDPMLRVVVLDLIDPGDRARLHRTAAGVVSDPGARLVHRVAATAGVDEGLATELEAAAKAERDRGGWEKVATFLMHASDLADAPVSRDHRRLDAIYAMMMAGDTAGARAAVDELEGAVTGPRHGLVLGQAALAGPDLTTAGPLLESAWEAVDPRAERALAAQIAVVSAMYSYFRLRGAAQVQWARRAIALSEPGDPVHAFAVTILAGGLAVTGSVEGGLGVLDQALASTPIEHGDNVPLRVFRGWIRTIADDLDGAKDDLTFTSRAASRAGAPATAGVSFARLASANYLAGSWDEAVAAAGRAVTIGGEINDPGILGIAHWAATLVPAARGDWETADRHTRAAATQAGTAELRIVTSAIAAAHVAVARADATGVLDALGPVLALRPLDALDQPGPWEWQPLYADALISLKRIEDADTFLSEQEARAVVQRRRGFAARLRRSRGRLEGARGANELAVQALLFAITELRSLGLPYERALAELAYGRLLRRIGQRREAGTQLMAAHATFHALGARPALERCELELSACGISLVGRETGNADGLTAQERSIAQLIVDGHSNREIAAQLLVSVKTVEAHITRLYVKLAVRSRAQLRSKVRNGELQLGVALTASV